MLRITPRQPASRPSFAPAVPARPRVARPVPVVPAAPERTIAVRGQLPDGGAAALIVEGTGVCIVSEGRSGRRRMRRFTIKEILAVEEHRSGRTTELVIVTATTAISVVGVEIAQAWSFCREVRQLILAK